MINGGAIDGYNALSGRNVAIITFDLQVAGNVQPGQTANLLDTATLFNYAGQEGGADHTNPTDLTDTAQVTIATPIQTKSIDATSEAHTGSLGANTLLAIGEIVRYRLVTQLPEGQSTNFQFRDNLPAGLQFLNDGTARVAFVSSAIGGVTSSNAALAGARAVGNGSFNPTFVVPASAISGGPFSSGTDPIFSFGNLTNSERDNDAEYVILEFNALTLNSVAASNDAGDTRDNTLQRADQRSAIGCDVPGCLDTHCGTVDHQSRQVQSDDLGRRRRQRVVHRDIQQFQRSEFHYGIRNAIARHAAGRLDAERRQYQRNTRRRCLRRHQCVGRQHD